MAIASLYPTIKPSLLLDFANSKKLDPRVTFTRSTTATYYDGVTTAKAEENLLAYSQQFENAYWTKTDTTVTADATTAPDGTATADAIFETATTASHNIYRNVLLNLSGTYTTSVFAKANGRNWIAINRNYASNQYLTYFDLQNGVVGSVAAGFTASIQSAGNGWYRCIVSGPTGNNTYPGGIVYTAESDGSTTVLPSFAGDVTKGVYLWGWQFEQRSAATAYTPTTTQPITNYIPQLLTAPAGVPRFDHNPTTGESLGLLVEEQRTNLILQSEDFDTTWAETRATLTLNSVVAPNGTQTADQLIASTDNDTHFTTQTFTGTAVAHTFTVYAKASGLSHVALRLFNGTSQVGLAYYNLSTGVPGTVAAGTASMTSVGNGWYRCVLTATLAASASCTADIYLASADNTNSFAGNAFDGVTLWGAQVEAGASPTSYIPTTSASVTRTADDASMTGGNFSSWYRQDEGSWLFDYKWAGGTAGNYAVTIGSNTADQFYVYGGGGSQLTVITNNSLQVNNLSAGTFLSNAYNRVSFTYKTNDFAVSLNASAVATDTSGLVPFADKLQIGRSGYGSAFPSNNHYRRLAYYPARLTNAQLQALTA